MFFHQVAKLSVGAIYFGNAETFREQFAEALDRASHRHMGDFDHGKGVDQLVHRAVDDLTKAVTSASLEERCDEKVWYDRTQQKIDDFKLACSLRVDKKSPSLWRGKQHLRSQFGNLYSNEMKRWLGDRKVQLSRGNGNPRKGKIRKVQLVKEDGTSVSAIVDEVHLGKHSGKDSFFIAWRDPWVRVKLLKPRVVLRDDWEPDEQYIEIHFVNGPLQGEEIKLPYSENETVEHLLQHTLADALDQKEVRKDCSQATFGGKSLDLHQTLIEAGVEAGGILHVRLADGYGVNTFNENKQFLKDEHGKLITQDVYLYTYDSRPFALDEHDRPLRSKLGANWMRWE